MNEFTDVEGRILRFTDERQKHIERRPEMAGQFQRIGETLERPDEGRKSNQDESVRLFYRHYEETPVSEKYLLVVAKVEGTSPYVITAFFTDRIKSGQPLERRTDEED